MLLLLKLSNYIWVNVALIACIVVHVPIEGTDNHTNLTTINFDISCNK